MEIIGVKGQKPRDFTVQIRHTTKLNRIIGAGIIVSEDGKIITCAHVIKDAGVNPHTRQRILPQTEWLFKNLFKRNITSSPTADDATVGVYFPQTQNREGALHHARILACFGEYDDDVVLLQLVGVLLTLPPEQIAILGAAELSEGNSFISYGYPMQGRALDTNLEGTILGSIEPPEDEDLHLQAYPLQLSSEDIDKGSSGAAVFDFKRNLVVAIITQTWPDTTTGTDRNTAWAVNARVLVLPSFNLPVREAPLERKPIVRPEVLFAAQEMIGTSLGTALYHAPPLLEEWIERKELLQQLNDNWTDPTCHITALIGDTPHAGKTCLTRYWLEMLESSSLSESVSVFWWGFHVLPDVDAFCEALLKFITGNRIDPQGFSVDTQIQIIGSVLDSGRYLFILDGLDAVQYQTAEQYGHFKRDELRQFLGYVAASDHNSFCLATSRIRLDLDEYSTYRYHLVDPLSQNIVLQNLFDFTVKILHPTIHGRTIGTGIVVSTEGHIVTCARILRSANIDLHAHATTAKLGIYFPHLTSGRAKLRHARVTDYFPQHDDDIVMLQLVDGPSPLTAEQIAILGTADESYRHPFRCYGYRRLDNYIAGRAQGRILGSIEIPPTLRLQADPVELRSTEINQDMQGSPVLDIERNLIVGIISEERPSSRSGKNRNKSIAVNARVLRFNPFMLPVREKQLEKRPAPQPKTDVTRARSLVATHLDTNLERAPRMLEIWAGRTELLAAMREDWVKSNRKITGLVGFGGEGKSSIAHRWTDSLLADLSLPQPNGVFWWAFYDRSSMDDFFEATLKYMSGNQINPRHLPSANLREKVIGAMLKAGRYLFILDGLEVLQYQGGDLYGRFSNKDLQEFLEYFTDPSHQSTCIITTRVRLLDLEQYETYVHREVGGLDLSEGRFLLRQLGVTGNDAALDRVVSDWDGHALTLTLLGTYLTELKGGDIAHINEIPPPSSNESRNDRIHRVLRRYDSYLTEAEKAFLTLFSAFRIPVRESAFAPVFRTQSLQQPALNAPIAALSATDFTKVIQRLQKYRLLFNKKDADLYSTHPLIHSYYSERLHENDTTQIKAVHESIEHYYLKSAGVVPEIPTLSDLTLVIEAVHHACAAEDYNKAFDIMWNDIAKRERYALGIELGALETAMRMLDDFFPDHNTSQEPLVSNPVHRDIVLNAYGYCWMALGKFGAARTFFTRVLSGDLAQKSWRVIIIVYRNLAELEGFLGEFMASDTAAENMRSLAIDTHKEASKLLALQPEEQEQKHLTWTINEASYFEVSALGRLAWNAYLRGDIVAAKDYYDKVLTYGQTQKEVYPRYRHGVGYADYLQRVGESTTAREVIQKNLELCTRENRLFVISMCHRFLGDLDVETEQYQSAREHYSEALRLARSVAHLSALIEVLIAQGRLSTQAGETQTALNSLDEALRYATDSDYHLYEVDIRVALALTYLELGDQSSARYMIDEALRMSRNMGYHWGHVDALAVLAKIEPQA